MSNALQTATHRLRKLYRDAHHCDAPSDGHLLDWAAKPERWAEYQIRFGNWSYHVAEATVREARRLSNRIAALSHPLHQQEPQEPAA